MKVSLPDQNFKIKQYPLRGVNIAELSSTKHEVCTCGHFRHLHHLRKECGDCLCPQYEYYTDMTFSEMRELEASRKGDIST